MSFQFLSEKCASSGLHRSLEMNGWVFMHIISNPLNVRSELPYTRSENTVTSFYTEGSFYSLMQAPHTSSSASTCHSVWGNPRQWQSCSLTLCHGVSSLSVRVDISVFSVFPSGSAWQIGLMGNSQDKCGQHRALKGAQQSLRGMNLSWTWSRDCECIKLSLV